MGSPRLRGEVGAWREGGEEEREPGAGWIPLASVGITEGREAELQRAVVLLRPTAAERPAARGSGQPRTGSLAEMGDRAVGVTSQRPHGHQKAAEQKQRLPAWPCNRRPRRCLRAAESVSFRED